MAYLRQFLLHEACKIAGAEGQEVVVEVVAGIVHGHAAFVRAALAELAALTVAAPAGVA